MKRIFAAFVAMIFLVIGCAMYQAKREFSNISVF